MAIVTVHAAKTNLSQLLERAEAGEEIIIARGQVPVARLVPIAPKPKRQFGLYAGLATVGPEFFDPLPEEELRLWEGGDDQDAGGAAGGPDGRGSAGA
jgi:prevent-host-death family protein